MGAWRREDQLALDRAVRSFDHPRVRELVRTYAAHARAASSPVDARNAAALVRKLQRRRYTLEVQYAIEALLVGGCDTIELRHRYSLALLDDGLVAASEALLQQLPPDVRRTDPEVAGALGRVHKQRYLMQGSVAGRRDELAAAVEVYLQTYRVDRERHVYHGINAASLLSRAHREQFVLPGHEDGLAEARGIAQEILTALDRRDNLAAWEYATAVEASLVLGEPEQALAWLVDYIGSDADAFEISSTLRQFEQLWELDGQQEPGRTLLTLLRARLLEADGGQLRVGQRELAPGVPEALADVKQGLERVFGTDRFQSLGWLRDGLHSCRSVARVQDRYGDGVGTGFVLDGAAVRPDWPPAVVLTNSHVVPDTLPVEDAYLTFRGGDEKEPVPAGTVLWRSDVQHLDACFLAPPEGTLAGIPPLSVRPRFPQLEDDRVVRAYVIGHPGGADEVHLSLHDTLVVHADDVYVHYRSPTEHGHSGSPVFDDQWRVFALHRGWAAAVPGAAGERSGPANEGIRLDRLVAEAAGGRAKGPSAEDAADVQPRPAGPPSSS